MSRKVTLTDVARAAQVSLATVDRVINGRGGVRADREERVLRAAQSLGLDRRSLAMPTRILRVAVLIQPPANPFHAELAAGVGALRPEFRALNLHFHIHHIDPDRPARVAADITRLQPSVDGVIVSSADTPEIAAALAAASRRMPVVTLATDIDGSGRAAYVGPDDLRSGRVAGELIGRYLGPAGGDVLMLAARMDIAGQRARAKGFAALVGAHFPATRLSEIVETGEDREITQTLTAAALTRNPALAAIYHTTTGVGGIVRALEARRRTEDIVVVTHELTPDRRHYLRARKIDAVIDQNPRRGVRAAAVTMARLLGRLDGEATSVSTDIRIYTPENA